MKPFYFLLQKGPENLCDLSVFLIHRIHILDTVHLEGNLSPYCKRKGSSVPSQGDDIVMHVTKPAIFSSKMQLLPIAWFWRNIHLFNPQRKVCVTAVPLLHCQHALFCKPLYTCTVLWIWKQISYRTHCQKAQMFNRGSTPKGWTSLCLCNREHNGARILPDPSGLLP